MKTIYKYPLKVEDEQTVAFPMGATVLSAAFQGETLYMWALIDKDEECSESQKIFIYGTGHEIIEGNSRFISTVFIGSLVFHVFVRNY